MKIDSAINSYFASHRSGAAGASRDAASAAAASAPGGAGAGSVTFSDAARQAADEAAAAGTARNGWDMVLEDARQDPAYARKAAYEFAHDDSYVLHGPLVDITKDPITYSGTDEPVTAEGLAAFKAQAAKARMELIGVYDAEKAKGTPDAEILEKLHRARDGQPADYLKKLHWA